MCGEDVDCHVLNSTNSFGSPDLDLRPPEMQRSTMDAWLQECPKCHFVNRNLTYSITNARAILESSRYQELIAKKRIPEVARKFACFALLNADDSEKAGEALVRSAWACDDAGAVEDAVAFRNQAADLLLSLQPFADNEDRVTLATALVDILRRASRFSDAQTLAMTLRSMKSVEANQIIGTVLDYQMRLCHSSDGRCYTIEDATKSE